ncbi:MAG: SDR family oxidoreductase [Hyphomicrobiales bacterium]|nr:SDR family oxidoreductase [Hyphomicrobiales bacterium]MCP5370307.1 SDR family oxidoreductase [Hyphomicrobiales bacterium]
MALHGRTVLVIGGSAGIGLAVAQAAAAQGARVHIAARDRGRLARAAEQIGAAGHHAADVTDDAARAALFDSVGPIDHLAVTSHLSSTRLGVHTAMDRMPLDGARKFMEHKFWSQYAAAQAALDHLSADGSIVLTSGVASRRPLAEHTVIAATNAAVEAMARQLCAEIAPRRINVVAPGLTDTRTYDHLSPESREAFFAKVRGLVPVARVATPADIARAYLFAMESDYLSGAVIDMDGGLLCAG